eukprot:CAMPEP_0195156100 /NCGR_PEP_ID=MMETSP0448-20130528/184492_1 /TAXON_ID=66468 /ORGANISM="Heterocapsa triquestra, Strain CCMP 448" /LENGTH=119 /DNA_ID=CAMNT_0040194891 /DNA_START=1297 /DNA_END=1654 /DNA_ORIENTATION=-
MAPVARVEVAAQVEELASHAPVGPEGELAGGPPMAPALFRFVLALERHWLREHRAIGGRSSSKQNSSLAGCLAAAVGAAGVGWRPAAAAAPTRRMAGEPSAGGGPAGQGGARRMLPKPR